MKVNWDIERLRGIAILYVLIHHLPYVASGGRYGPFYHWFNPWTGVDLFFVISGFIVTKTYIESGQTLRAFFIRRIFRIVPLATAWIVIPLFLSFWLKSLPTKDLAYDLVTVSTATFNLADVFGIHHGVIPPYWSLSIEQQFYLALPFLLIVRNRTALLIASIAFISFGLRPMLIYAGFDANFQHKFSLLKFDTLAAGVLLYFCPIKWNFNRWVLVGLCAAIGVLPAVIAPEFHVTRYAFALPLITLTSALVVAAAAQDKDRFPRFLDWFGSRSYALYLVHWPAIWFSGGSLWRFAAIVFCLAELSHRLIERPLIRLGKTLSSKNLVRPASVAVS